MAVLEILSTMRDIARKQDAFEAKEAAEKMRNNGLTDREAAELEVKRAEIARIEARTLMSEERTARACSLGSYSFCGAYRLAPTGINEKVAKLAERTEKADQLLKEIAQNVQEGKKTQIDPALSEEVKKLLTCVRSLGISGWIADGVSSHSGVRAGVDDHVKDFRGQLTSEVCPSCGVCAIPVWLTSGRAAQIQRMFKEVGGLRQRLVTGSLRILCRPRSASCEMKRSRCKATLPSFSRLVFLVGRLSGAG